MSGSLHSKIALWYTQKKKNTTFNHTWCLKICDIWDHWAPPLKFGDSAALLNPSNFREPYISLFEVLQQFPTKLHPFAKNRDEELFWDKTLGFGKVFPPSRQRFHILNRDANWETGFQVILTLANDTGTHGFLRKDTM